MRLLQDKIKPIEEISKILEPLRGKKIIQCHGVFDLVHPGHIRHFQEAKSLGDILIVTVTPDRFVNKGPGRPVFTESLRIESLAALEMIDIVVLNDSPDAISAIQRVKPSFYVKGAEYKNHEKDVTGKISEEANAVERSGGQIYYTDDIVFSSSSLLNQSQPSPAFIQELKKQHSIEEIIQKIEALSQLKVLVIGDAIIDEYQYIEPLGQSGKGLQMVVRCQEKEVFLGGSLIIANHIAQFAKNVTLVTAVGQNCPHLPFIHQNLDPKIEKEFIFLEGTTLIKKRYVQKDGETLLKLFETYSKQDPHQTCPVISSQFDLVLVCDFGNGFTHPSMIDEICNIPSFLALNTQTNSGNRGFNPVTNYKRANYISLNEFEIRFAARDRTSSLQKVASDIAKSMGCQTISVTRGVNGVFCFHQPQNFIEIPALASNPVDRIGAGDNYFALSALCLAKGYTPALSAFLGSAAAAMSIQIVGNRSSIQKSSFLKFITRLMK